MKKLLLLALFTTLSFSALFCQSEFSYIIQVARLEQGFDRNKFADIQHIGKLIVQQDQKIHYVYLVAYNSKFFNEWEAIKKLGEIKKHRGYEKAFIINIQDRIPLKEYVNLENDQNLDRLRLTIDLNKEVEALVEKGGTTDYDKTISNRKVAVTPSNYYGHYTLQIMATDKKLNNLGLKKLQLLYYLQDVQLIKPFLFPPGSATKYKYFYNNFGMNFAAAQEELNQIKMATGCEQKNNCPIIVFFDRDFRYKSSRYPSIRKINERLVKFYAIQVGAGSLRNFNGDEEAFKNYFINLNPKLKGKDLKIGHKNGSDYVYTGKFLDLKSAEKEKARIGNAYIVEFNISK